MHLGGLWCGDLPPSVGQEARDTVRCTYVVGHIQGADGPMDPFTAPGAGRCSMSLRTRQGQDSTCPDSLGPLFNSVFGAPQILPKKANHKNINYENKKMEVEVVEKSILSYPEGLIASMEASI